MQKNGTGSENFLYVGVVKLFIFFFFSQNYHVYQGIATVRKQSFNVPKKKS